MIKDFIEKYWATNRQIVGGYSTELLLRMYNEYGIKQYGYDSGKRVMTWRVPEEWVVNEAYIEDEQGNRYLDYADNPLYLVAYSTAIDKWIGWEEFKKHFYTSIQGIPWKFKYYERDWGFCAFETPLADELFEGHRVHVVIDAEFKQGTMLVGELQLGNLNQANLLITSHYDHPYQANDGLSGVAVALGVYKRLQQNPPDWIGGVRFIFVPETIGSTAYFTDHKYDNIAGGIFLDACGNDNAITYQTSFNSTVDHDGMVDIITLNVLDDKFGWGNFDIKGFRNNFCNDEIVINSPPMNIPCIGLSRYPYSEYHTSADTIDIIKEDKLVEMADVTEEIVRRFCTDYIPTATYDGVPFLSGYNLWVDWQDNPELNKNIEKIFMRFNGEQSVSQIADEVDMDYWQVRELVEKFRTAGLVNIKPIERGV